MGLCLIYDIALIFSFEYYEFETSNFCEVISLKEETTYNNKYIIKILGRKLILYTSLDIELMPGDIVNVEGSFTKAETARNYKGFNYDNYLKQSKIYGIIYSNNITKLTTKKDIYYIRGIVLESIIEKIQNLYNDDSCGFIEAILFGYTNNIEENIIENFRVANISHILAISGLHIEYVICIVCFILKKTFKNKKAENYILIVFIVSFWFITGESISCTRACMMTIISILSFNFRRRYNFYISYIFSFIIIIILNPFNIFNVGMWLSYLGILGIKLFSDFFKTICYHLINIHEILKIFVQNIIMSVCVQIMIFPVLILNFNIISFNFLLSNIIVFLFIDKIIALGYLSIFFSFVNPNLGLFFSNINEFLINIFFNIIQNINNLPLSKIYVKTPYLISIFIYYFIIFGISLFYRRNKHYILRLFCSATFIEVQIKRLMKKTSYIIVIIILIFCSVQIHRIFETSLNIYFVDVGQGDCTLIKTPKGKSILIDGGEGASNKYDYGKNVVLPYLLDRRINMLDYIIISHFDSDHVGGIISIIEEIKVKRIIIEKQFEESENYEEFLNLVQKNKIQVQIVEAGNEIYIEKNLYFNILWPTPENIIYDNVANNNSLVCKLVYKDFSILFTGDIEEVAEKALISRYNDSNILNSTILKVAHHGSKTSSTIEFLQEVSPKYALIGVGKNNIFGHPSDITLENLESINCRIYRTDEDGEIVIKTNGKKIRIRKFII